MNEPAVLCLGATFFDRVVGVDALHSVSAKLRARRWLGRGGGPAATAAMSAARLGVRAELRSRVGMDSEGETLLRSLTDNGVDTRYVARLPLRRTPQAIVLVDVAGERVIIGHPDNGYPEDEGVEALADLSQSLSSARAVLADTSWLNGTRTTFEMARARNLPTVLDVEVGRNRPDVLERLTRLSSYAIFPEHAWALVTGEVTPSTDAMRAFHDRTRATVAVTLGHRGSVWLIDDETIEVPAQQVEVTDTTGAGDVFHGAFAAGLALGADLRGAIAFATAAAALKCRLGDGWEGMPDRSQVDELLKEKMK